MGDWRQGMRLRPLPSACKQKRIQIFPQNNLRVSLRSLIIIKWIESDIFLTKQPLYKNFRPYFMSLYKLV